MKTGKKIDSLLSGEGGLMKGTNFAFIGDPGVGKSTVMLDILADLQAKGQKCLFISGEMTSIDLYAYKQGVPYTSIVPAFPILTNKHTIDYGNQISIP